MSINMNDLLAFLRSIEDQAGDRPGKIAGIVGEKFPTCTVGDMKRAFETLAMEERERAAELLRESEQITLQMRVFEGLPPDTEFIDACRIKAAAGDWQAQRLLAEMESPEYRRREALGHAAYLAQGWKEDPADPDALIWPGPGKPPEMEGAELVDWFQRTHPRQARKFR